MIKMTVRAAFDLIASRLARDSEQAVIVPGGIAPAVGVGVGQQQAIAVTCDRNAPEPSIVTSEVSNRVAGLGAIKRNLPEPFAAQSGHPQIALPVGQPR